MADGEARASDLRVRTVSAIVMLVVAGIAVWLGGWFWTGFVVLVTLGVFFEWQDLTAKFAGEGLRAALWLVGGALYLGIAACTLVFMRGAPGGLALVLVIAGMVIATDIGAYFAGRAIGGPKIAPSISPSKTWAGLGGGVAGASLVLFLALRSVDLLPLLMRADLAALAVMGLTGGALTAVVAQSGDFFESWMKRRAGVKDSGKLIPGHGGLFDRVDGLLAVCFAIGFATLVIIGYALASGTPLLPQPA